MAMNQFSPALLEVLDSANKINPVTPQGRPTIAANVMQQAGKPVQGLPGVLAQTQQAAPSVAENMQEQQFGQMLAKTQPQPPAMMAEGGIASLPMGDEDYEYADGGIIGYAGGGTSDVGDEGSIIRRLIDWMKSSKKEEAEPEPQPMVPMIPNKGLEQAAAAEPDKPASYGFPERSYMEAALRQAPPAARPAQRPGVGIEQALPPAAKEPTLTEAAKEAMGLFPRPDDTRLRAEGERLRGLQALRPTSEAEMEANRIAREEQKALYEKIRGRDTGLGELMSVLGGISQRTGALEGLEGYRTKRDTAAAKETEAARLFAQQQSLLEKKDYADKIGDVKASMEIEQALIKNQEEYNKAMIPASTSAYSTKAQQVSSAADRAARAKEGEADRAADVAVRKMRDPLAQEFIDSWMAANPGKPLYEAVEAYRGAGKGIPEKLTAAEIARNMAQRAKIVKEVDAGLRYDKDFKKLADPSEKTRYRKDKLLQEYALAGVPPADTEDTAETPPPTRMRFDAQGNPVK